MQLKQRVYHRSDETPYPEMRFCHRCDRTVPEGLYPQCHLVNEDRCDTTLDNQEAYQAASPDPEGRDIEGTSSDEGSVKSEEDDQGFEVQKQTCGVCNRSVECRMANNGSCHERCHYCGVNKPHNYCEEVNSDIWVNGSTTH